MKKIILLVTLLFIFIPIKVLAYNDSFYEGEYIPNAYLIKLRNGSGKYEQMKVLRRKSDNKAVYCLELWETIKTNTNLTGYDNWQYHYANIEEWKWQRIVLISYYGYGYLNHNDLNWYAATQYMIWEILSPDSVIYFTDKLNGNKVNKFQTEMDEIKRLINEHSITPTIPYEQDLLYNKEYTFIDTNNVLDKYEIIDAPGIKYTKDKNVLKVTNTKKERTAFKFYKEDKLYKNNPIVYISDKGQNLLLTGSYPTVIKTSYFNIKTTDLIINKLDKDTNSNIPSGDASFKNTKFELYDEKHNLIETQEINDSGQIIFKNVGYGKYYIKEIESGLGYRLNNIEEEINVDENNTYNFYNTVIKNTIKIHKMLKNLDGTVENENAKFIVLDSKEKEVLTFETLNGFYEFELPYGKYIIKQISGNENYKYIDDINIKVDEDNIVQTLDLYNEEIYKNDNKEIGDIIEPNINQDIIEEIIEDVPNTYKNSSINIINILMINISILYLKGKKYV